MSSTEDLAEFERREQDCEVEEGCVDNFCEEVDSKVDDDNHYFQRTDDDDDDDSRLDSCLEIEFVQNSNGYVAENDCEAQVEHVACQDDEHQTDTHESQRTETITNEPASLEACAEVDGGIDIREDCYSVDEDVGLEYEGSIADETQQTQHAVYDEPQFSEKDCDDGTSRYYEEDVCCDNIVPKHFDVCESTLKPDLLPCTAADELGFREEFSELEDSAIVEDGKLQECDLVARDDAIPDIASGIDRDVPTSATYHGYDLTGSDLITESLGMSEDAACESELSGSVYEVVTDDINEEPVAEVPTVEDHVRPVEGRPASGPGLEIDESTTSDDYDEAFVVENTPIRRQDVVREDDKVEGSVCLKKGFAKDLAGFWSSPKSETPAKQAKQPIDVPRDDSPHVAENNPQRLEGVVRSDDVPEDHVAERGHAKMMVHLFQTKKEDGRAKELKLDINFEEPGVYENSPKEREGVVRNCDVVDEVKVQKGVIRSIADKFLCREDGPCTPRDVIKIEPARGPSIVENTPEAPMADVVRSDSKVEEDLPDLQGMTRNLVHKWKTNDLLKSTSAPKMIDDLDSMLTSGGAAESGVFENQPTVRTDVVREDDEQPDIIPTQKTRSTRDLWNQKINQEGKPVEKTPQLVRFTPPRELSPPRRSDDSFKSFQQLTLA